MENGLIFPYPCASVHTEVGDANRAAFGCSLRGMLEGGVGTDPVVGK